MKKIFDKKEIADYIASSQYYDVFDSLDVDFYLIKYEKGELVCSPFQNELLFQIVEQGSVTIYFIRDDGTRYSLSSATTGYLLGDMEIFYPKSSNIYAQADEDVTCISFSIQKYREILLSNHKFLALICRSLSAKIGAMTRGDNSAGIFSYSWLRILSIRLSFSTFLLIKHVIAIWPTNNTSVRPMVSQSG